ncbi:MAG: hypothetical protein ACFFCS_28860 [Candidatus Hodarchaeota archaeon]
MKERTKKKAILISVFAVFLLASIGIEVQLDFHPIKPTKVGDEPFGVSLNQIDDYSTTLEGNLITFTTQIFNTSYNASIDVLTFLVKDETHDLEFTVIYNNWSSINGGIQVAELLPGTLCAILAVSRVTSIGNLEGIELQILHPNPVYILSIVGLIITVALILYHYKIDLKRFLLVVKKKNKEAGE